MTNTELAALDEWSAEGYAYEAYLMGVLADGTPVYASNPQAQATAAVGLAYELDPEILEREIEWEWLDSEPGYYESLQPYNY